jgi:dihydroorotate dehydrogenase
MIYQQWLRPVLFTLDPEDAHERALRLATRCGRNRILRESFATWFRVEDGRLRQAVFGIEFPNPVGLGAGYDKNAVGLDFWPALGFGFVEIGSVTSRPQGGNPRPRSFRLPEQAALINRMGFNNDGAERVAARIHPPYSIPVGVNVGKFKEVPLEQAAADYATTIQAFAGKADFFVINVSSPNTPGLRKLQDREFLDGLLAGIRADAPVLLKLAPDLTFDQLDDALVLVQKHKLAGIVATNTTLDHPVPPEGGLSGKPLRDRATECIRHLYRQSSGTVPLIGVGGIFSAEDAYEKICAGASLVEVWTGLIYEGPALVAKINHGLCHFLERDGFGGIHEAIGTRCSAL